jgi:hypothetical protein
MVSQYLKGTRQFAGSFPCGLAKALPGGLRLLFSTVPRPRILRFLTRYKPMVTQRCQPGAWYLVIASTGSRDCQASCAPPSDFWRAGRALVADRT